MENSGKNGISWKVDQNSQTEIPNENCAFHSLFLTSSRPFGLDRLELQMEQQIPYGNSHSGFDAFHLPHFLIKW